MKFVILVIIPLVFSYTQHQNLLQERKLIQIDSEPSNKDPISPLQNLQNVPDAKLAEVDTGLTNAPSIDNDSKHILSNVENQEIKNEEKRVNVVSIAELQKQTTESKLGEPILKPEELPSENKKKLQNEPNQAGNGADNTSFDIKFKCNTVLLNNYGFDGEVFAQVDNHQYCPSVKRNCCTATDQMKSMNFWEQSNVKSIETYYESFLLMINYYLGFTKEFEFISNEFLLSTDVCGVAAAEYKSLNTHRATVDDLQKKFKASISFLVTLRAGFYCHLCDFDFHRTATAETGMDFKGSITISKDSCSRIVNGTLASNYYFVTYFKKLADSMLTLTYCKYNKKKGLSNDELQNLHYLTLDEKEVYKIKKCYDSNGLFSFTACESYCGLYNFVNPNPYLDGNLEELKKMFDQLKSVKNDVFMEPEQNNYLGSVRFEESVIINNLQGKEKSNVLYPTSGINDKTLENYEVNSGGNYGIDIWNDIVDKKYRSYLWAGLLKGVSYVLITFLLLN